ncbi:SMC-like chromosome segregation protein [Hamiltosporidium tvaerminnensis]|uniref:SMC-like chromosome segregation protein n=1 Tax=Hamiltosporidium tvaerminnensis TaxID=1176355 RepID=A0A4Q9LBH3_9MICR|nr:SMC-like chromosome segregation protein [Hamiltosporidium tvaerminnensis]
MNCFNKISNSITRIYKELTKSESEGSAYLILENTDDPFKEGIKYHVMPPRKRFREIKDLSGGEQSIASLALLFAIQEYKPSLFYIFDEIDAPLDKFNVFKLSQYFENFPTQKIIVTHKINLFQFSESLIGVYKNKEGVSKTLSYSNKGVLNFSSLIGYTSSSKGVDLNYSSITNRVLNYTISIKGVLNYTSSNKGVSITNRVLNYSSITNRVLNNIPFIKVY